ncbi:MAG: DUF3618 domain-containing protein [Polyangiales bacterium]
MTSSNIVDTTRQSQNGHSQEKTPEEIQLEIARTRTAITEDLLAISERLSPQHLRESAREMMRDAREEAREMLRDAKDAAVDSLVGVKDRAVERVSESVSLLGTQARRASDMTVSFVSANSVAVSLVGFGVGFLLIALQRRRRTPPLLQRGYSHEHYELEGSEPLSRPRLTEQVRSVASHASQAVDHARAEVRGATTRATREAREGLTHANQGIRHAARRTRRLAADNRVAVLAVTVAAGLGFGLLWPTGARERVRDS